MSRVYGSPFDVDWCNLAETVAYAKRLAKAGGADMAVVQYPGRKNYNIAHLSRFREMDDGAVVLCRVKGRDE